MKSLFLNIIVFGILVSLAACARELATNEEQLIEEEITSSYSPKANMQDIKAFIEERGKGIPVKGPATYEIAPILNDADTVMYLVNYYNTPAF